MRLFLVENNDAKISILHARVVQIGAVGQLAALEVKALPDDWCRRVGIYGYLVMGMVW